MTCALSKDSDQPGCRPNWNKVFALHSVVCGLCRPSEPNLIVDALNFVGRSICLWTIWTNDCSKARVKWPLSKRPKIGFQAQLSLNAGQKYCRMIPFVIKIFVCHFLSGCSTQERGLICLKVCVGVLLC